MPRGHSQNACVVLPLREPAADGGHDAADMRAVLAAAGRSLAHGAARPNELRMYAEYLEAMAFAGARRWFSSPRGLGGAVREYLALADEILTGLDPHRVAERDAEAGARSLMSAMTLLVSRVIEHVGDPEQGDDTITPALLLTASGASERFRRWCPHDEPGKAAMLAVGAYAVVGATTRAIERIEHQSIEPGPLVEGTLAALDEATAAVHELVDVHGPTSCLDQGLGGHWGGEASRAIRALHGIAWARDVLGQMGVVPEPEPLLALLGVIEDVWPCAGAHANEAVALVGALGHVTSAWSIHLELGAWPARSSHALVVANRAAWLGRQAGVRHPCDLAVAHQLLALAQAMTAVAGVALDRGLDRDVTLAIRAAALVESVVARACGAIVPSALMGVIDNLTRVAAIAAERRASACPQLLRALTEVTSAAVATRMAAR